MSPRSATFRVVLPSTAILAAASAVLLAPQFRVLEVRVEGGSNAVRAAAAEQAWQTLRARAVFLGEPRLVLVPRDVLADDIVRSVPRIHTVRVRRQLPSILALDLQEKVPLAFLDIQGTVYALDSDGIVIEETTPADVQRSQLPIVRNERATSGIVPGTVVVSAAVMNLLHEVVVLLPDRLGVGVAELIIPAVGTEEVHVRTDRGWVLLLDAQRNLGDQLRTFEQAVAEALKPDERERLEYVDLRVAGKVFYRIR